MAIIATTMRLTTQIASMMIAAGKTGPDIALFERINVTLQRPKVTTIVTAKMMAVFARLARGGGGGVECCSEEGWTGCSFSAPDCVFVEGEESHDIG